VDALDEPDLPLALTILAAGEPAVLPGVAGRLRLSNQDAKAAAWLAAAAAELGGLSAATLRDRPWSAVQPWLADARAPRLADLLRARAACGHGDPTAAAWVTAQLARPAAEIDPPPLVSGDDLLALGVSRGPAVGSLLQRIRRLQLDGGIASRDEALASARGGPTATNRVWRPAGGSVAWATLQQGGPPRISSHGCSARSGPRARGRSGHPALPADPRPLQAGGAAGG
jgi:hypothetical protein